MPGIVDFDEWSSAPGFTVSLRGSTYEVSPRSVDDWGLCLASAALAEHNLGLVAGDPPEGIRERLATIKPGDHPALGEVYGRMIDDGLPQPLVDRVAYYAVFLVARGRAYADALAALLWAEPAAESGEPAPKG